MKPKFRGHSHQHAFLVALGAGAMLIATCASHAVVAVSVYVASLVALLGVSALYHRPMWPERTREFFKRLDHAMIFMLIAGTYTPFCVLAIPWEMGRVILAVMWGVGIVLALTKVAGVNMPRWLLTLSYVGLGWFAAWSIPDAIPQVGVAGAALLVAGGVFYTTGAVIYWRKFPNPAPNVFGYHEVFHLFVIVASVLHFIAIARLVLPAAAASPVAIVAGS
jgi:hemolysin III